MKQEIEGKVGTIRSAIEAEDTSQIKTALDDLQISVQKVGQLVYSQAGGSEGGDSPDPGPEGEEKPPDETVEGEYREV